MNIDDESVGKIKTYNRLFIINQNIDIETYKRVVEFVQKLDNDLHIEIECFQEGYQVDSV